MTNNEDGKETKQDQLERRINEEAIYKIVHPYKEKVNPNKDLIDIEVEFNGKTYRGSITTTKFIGDRLEKYKRTGENSAGAYFCAKGMIVLKDLEERTIRDALADLIKRGDLQEFLEI